MSWFGLRKYFQRQTTDPSNRPLLPNSTNLSTNDNLLEVTTDLDFQYSNNVPVIAARKVIVQEKEQLKSRYSAEKVLLTSNPESEITIISRLNDFTPLELEVIEEVFPSADFLHQWMLPVSGWTNLTPAQCNIRSGPPKEHLQKQFQQIFNKAYSTGNISEILIYEKETTPETKTHHEYYRSISDNLFAKEGFTSKSFYRMYDKNNIKSFVIKIIFDPATLIVV